MHVQLLTLKYLDAQRYIAILDAMQVLRATRFTCGHERVKTANAPGLGAHGAFALTLLRKVPGKGTGTRLPLPAVPTR